MERFIDWVIYLSSGYFGFMAGACATIAIMNNDSINTISFSLLTLISAYFFLDSWKRMGEDDENTN